MGARILVVCSANVCRSPFAQQLLAARLGGGLVPGLIVESAGTRIPAGLSSCPTAEATATSLGLPPPGRPHRPRALSRALIDQADLILTAEQGHRAVVAELAPEARTRTFTLLEAAGLGSSRRYAPQAGAGVGRGEVLTAFAARLNHARGLPLATLDIPDGHGLSPRRHRAALRSVERAVSEIAAELALDQQFPKS